MKMRSKIDCRWRYLLAGLFMLVLGQLSVLAQEDSSVAGQGTRYIEPDEDAPTSDAVTINVKDANISEVLKAYSLQTGQSIVVGPDVVSDNVNVRLNNIPWQEALDVILKPYGFGYRVMGDTIVISRLENIIEVEGIEPLVTKVFNLKYLDAYDIQAVCEAQLSGRGKFTVLSTTGLPGWEFGGAESSGSSGAATDGGIRRRNKDKEQIQKSKVFIITDVPASVAAISDIIRQMDRRPRQVLIEAKFLEINTDGLRDIGLDYITAMENIQASGSSSSSTSLEPSALPDQINNVLNMTTGYPDPLQMGAAGSLSQANGLRLSSSELGDSGYEMLFSMIASDGSANVLSAPRILTLNNQEAAILVGEKYPIINSDTSSAGGSQTQSESLDYYENIGIQLNVIPQVCDENFINMIVHPAVSEINTTAGTIGGNSYPRLKVREAETQVLIQSGNTAVIGGLQYDREVEGIQKIPFLGDIPYIGRLFRRETTTKEKIDLLIFIKVSIIDEPDYAKLSLERQKATETRMKMNSSEETAAAEAGVDKSSEDMEALVANMGAVDAERKKKAEQQEIVTFVEEGPGSKGAMTETSVSDSM